MNEPVQDRVRKGGIGDSPMPLGDGNLGSDEGGGVSEAVIQDFQNILCILDGDRISHPIIKNQQAAFCQGTQGAGEGTIAADLAQGMQ